MDERDAYLAVHGRLAGLLEGRDGAEQVASCPEWSVREVIAHLTGLCEDWIEGQLDGYATEAWTARQVERFSGAALDDILDSWRRALAPFLALGPHQVMGPPARWAFGDAVVHETDIHGALESGRVPDEAVALALKGQIARWRQVMADARAPTLLVRCPGLREWWLGEHGDADAVVVEAPANEVFRGLAGRRSRQQIAAWSWSADPSPFLDAGLPYPFTFATDPIVEEAGDGRRSSPAAIARSSASGPDARVHWSR